MERMEKQTAVNWLEIELEKLWVEKYLSPITIKPLLEQANEMFEKQIMDAWNEGHFEITGCIDAEQYYNETFKSE